MIDNLMTETLWQTDLLEIIIHLILKKVRGFLK